MKNSTVAILKVADKDNMIYQVQMSKNPLPRQRQNRGGRGVESFTSDLADERGIARVKTGDAGFWA